MSDFALLAAVDPNWMFVAGIAVLTSVMIRWTYLRQRQQRPRTRATNSGRASGSPLVASPYLDLLRRLESKEVELQELSREIQARLDNKIVVLQRLLAESEAVIERLQEAQRQVAEVVANPSHR